jgi:hypothetical protein
VLLLSESGIQIASGFGGVPYRPIIPRTGSGDCMGKRLDVEGKVYTHWTVIGESEPVDYIKKGRPVQARAVVVRCDCGTIRSVLLQNLCSRRSKSCGCRGKTTTRVYG